MDTIYITEPTAINASIIKGLVPAGCHIIEGTTTFEGNGLDDCTVLAIRSATKVSATIKSHFPNLKHIIRVGVGVDNVDMDFCNAEGIAVYNAPGANADAVSDYIVAMMLHALRNLNQLTHQDIQSWNRFKFNGHSLGSRTIGIVGFGNIGKQIFSKLQGFNCQGFYIYDPFLKPEDTPAGATNASNLDDVLSQCDIVTLHLPLLDSTRYLINKDNLSLLPDGAILINASRGGIVNEVDIVAYMADHDLTYIADTVEGEPHVSQAMLDSPRTIITPHIASLTKEANDNVIKVAVQNYLDNKPMNKPETN